VDLGIKDQVAIITGAGRGIGREVALAAAADGMKLVLNARSQAELEEVAAACAQRGVEVAVVAADLALPETTPLIIRAALDRFGRIDALVNNAGVNHIGNLVMSKEADWRAVYELNVFAVFRLTQAVVRQMVRQKHGRIVNVSSVSAKVGAPYNTAYSSSKAALIGFTHSLAKEVAQLGITVNAVCPWFVDTALVRYGMEKRGQMTGKTAEEFLAHVAQESPQKRILEAREVAGAVMYLISADARGITGQAINVCGGVAMG
jgi:NAD(P)-dependent dehydrogenase (short-subunit alcohol dehydrogenase family)